MRQQRVLRRAPPAPVQPLELPVPQQLLFRWNVAMGLLHTLFACVTLALGNLSLSPPLYKTSLRFQVWNTTTLTWSDARAAEGNAWRLVPYYISAGGLPVTWLTALFCALSALFHALAATRLRGYYEANLRKAYTPLRWIEYSLSAPVMIVVVAYSLGVRARAEILCLAVLMGITMPFGHWMQVITRPRTLEQWEDPRRVYPWLLGMVPFLTAWIVIFLQFYDNEWDGNRIPWFVYVILWVEFFLFLAFALVAAYGLRLPPRDFARSEIAYQVLSLVSKGVLSILLVSNVLMLSRFEDIYAVR